MGRPTQAIIDLQALRNNFEYARSKAPDSNFVAVLKANACGHGLERAGKTLSMMTEAFGVACIEEAIALRRASIQNPILLMEGIFTQDEVKIASENNFWMLVENDFQLNSLISSKLSQPVKVFFGIDTGMHRLGFQTKDFLSKFEILQSSVNVKKPIVISTHFSCADDLDSDFTALQINQFDEYINKNNLTTSSYEQSLSNSAGLLGWPNSRRQWQRPGYMLYGNSPFLQPHEADQRLEPAMDFKSKIISLRNIPAGASVGYGRNWLADRETKIATVTVGYADGYPRNARNGTPILVKGKLCPLVGRVSMDMITIDVTDLNEVSIGDDVLLWGKGLSVNRVAKYCNSIGWELLARITARVPRHYVDQI